MNRTAYKAWKLEQRLRKAFDKRLVARVDVAVVPVSDGGEMIVVRAEFADSDRTIELFYGPEIGAYDLAREARREISKVLDELLREFLAEHEGGES